MLEVLFVGALMVFICFRFKGGFCIINTCVLSIRNPSICFAALVSGLPCFVGFAFSMVSSSSIRLSQTGFWLDLWFAKRVILFLYEWLWFFWWHHGFHRQTLLEVFLLMNVTAQDPPLCTPKLLPLNSLALTRKLYEFCWNRGSDIFFKDTYVGILSF